MVESLSMVVLDKNPEYREAKILERIVEPERVIMFRVPWVDDKGEIQVNRGFRIEFNSAIGPYKGGLRFHPTVNLGILKFLAFEQIFKNSLTTLPMGGGKGGSDFDPKGKSDNEVMRFCQSFMTELCRHIGADTDVPAGDIGVGGREIGFLFGQYKTHPQRVHRRAHRQGPQLGRLAHPSRGDRLRRRLLRRRDARDPRRDARGQDLPRLRLGQRGPVHRREGHRARRQGRHLSDSTATSTTRTASPREARVRHGAQERHAAAASRSTPRSSTAPSTRRSTRRRTTTRCGTIKGDCAFPCATQNEINGEDAKNLVKNGCTLRRRGRQHADRPRRRRRLPRRKASSTVPARRPTPAAWPPPASRCPRTAMRLLWTREEVDSRLHGIMKAIHRQCVDAADEYGKPGNYVAGANIAGFVKVADSMLDRAWSEPRIRGKYDASTQVWTSEHIPTRARAAG